MLLLQCKTLQVRSCRAHVVYSDIAVKVGSGGRWAIAHRSQPLALCRVPHESGITHNGGTVWTALSVRKHLEILALVKIIL
jgi:hypothetical protein